MQNRDQKDRPKRRQQFRQRSRDRTAGIVEIPHVDSSVPVYPPKGRRIKAVPWNYDESKKVAVYCRVSTSENEEVRSCKN